MILTLTIPDEKVALLDDFNRYHGYLAEAQDPEDPLAFATHALEEYFLNAVRTMRMRRAAEDARRQASQDLTLN